VQQIFVHGDSLQSYLVAVLVPDPLTLAPLASTILGEKVAPDDTPALEKAIKDPRVVAQVLTILNKEAKKNRLAGFETIKRLHISLHLFSIEDNTLTPTLKLRRKDAYAKYSSELQALYALGEPKASKL